MPCAPEVSIGSQQNKPPNSCVRRSRPPAGHITTSAGRRRLPADPYRRVRDFCTVRARPDRSLGSFQPRFQIRERVVSRRRCVRRLRIPTMLRHEALMLVLVAVGAQQLPVAAVFRIVVVIVVPVVHLEQAQIGMGEFPATASANPRIHLQRAVAVALSTLFARSSCFRDDAIEARIVGSGLSRGHLSLLLRLELGQHISAERMTRVNSESRDTYRTRTTPYSRSGKVVALEPPLSASRAGRKSARTLIRAS